MRYLKSAGAALTMALVAVNPVSAKSDIDIPYEKFVLDNGLTLVVHEDRKAPIVAVNVWYHVGSKNEKPGKTGFAHLFEHLMFNGSENFNDEYFRALDQVGATGTNGTTNFDRTNYFQEVPSNAVDVALWLEADRMGHLLGAVDQDKLDEQRGVVQNEKRQGENQPYGRVFTEAFKNIFPSGHPYSWPVIGYMEDLNAAELEDVHEWFKTYYGAANATIVLAGDISPEVALEKVKQHFGHIPAGPPVTTQELWIPKMEGDHSMTMQDRVPQSRLYKIYMAPENGNIEANRLDLAAGILSEGKTSRLYQRLVFEDQIASNVASFAFPLEIAGMFGVIATAMPGVDLADLEAVIDEEIARFMKEGPTKEELKRITTNRKASFLRGIERIGGFGGKSDILAQNQVYFDDPGFFKKQIQRWESASVDDVQDVAKKWMAQGSFALNVLPYPEYTNVGESQVDRSKLPTPGDFPKVNFDDFTRAQLSNGLNVVIAERKAIPTVNMQMHVNAGTASDYFSKPGVAQLAMNMLDEGTKKMSSLEISDATRDLGMTLGTGSNLDMSTVSMSALTENLDDSLDIFADVILNPVFPEGDIERLRKLQLTQIAQEKVQPVAMAQRVFPKLLYGSDHAYGQPLTGSGTEEAVKSISRNDLVGFHNSWFKPNNATLIVVGDVSANDILPKLENAFEDWDSGDVPEKPMNFVTDKAGSKVYIVDRPDSQQSIIFAGHLIPPKSTPDDIAINMMNGVLGGSFNARINMNLREDKSWAYGAYSFKIDAQGQRPFLLYAPVQTDRTADSMAELQAEARAITGERPPQPDEVERVRRKQTLQLPGQWETAGSVAGSLAQMVRYGLPDDYWDTYADKVSSIDENKVSEVAAQYVKPDNMVWVVVGDRAKIEENIKALDIGEIQYLDAQGNPVE